MGHLLDELSANSHYDDEFGCWTEWSTEIEKWLSFITQKDNQYYITHNKRANNSKQRDELLGEYKAAFIIEEKCAGKVITFEPQGNNLKRLDFSFNDLDSIEWMTEVKSPSWRGVVSKQIDEKYLKELLDKKNFVLTNSEHYPKCTAEISCPSCKAKFKFELSDINNIRIRGLEIKKQRCPHCNKNIWHSSELKRKAEKEERLSCPQYISGEGHTPGFDIFEEAIVSAVQKFEKGKNNLLILCPNDFAEIRIFGAVQNRYQLRKLITELDKENKISCVCVFEVSLKDNAFKYSCEFVPINSNPKLNNNAVMSKIVQLP